MKALNLRRASSAVLVTAAAHVLKTGAWLALLTNDADTATGYLDTALATYAELANPGCSCHALEALAWWLAVRNQNDAANSTLHAVLAIRTRDHHHRAAYESVPYRGVTNLLGTAPSGPPAFDDLTTGINLARDQLRR